MKNEYTRPEYYENRELSWLGFDERILSEARDKSIPLFERLKFLSITASNLDEFFMVRVASLLDMVNAEYKGKDIAGMSLSTYSILPGSVLCFRDFASAVCR